MGSNDGGVVRTVPVISDSAEVSRNGINNYEAERRKMAEQKEDRCLERLCDGKDASWRPDNFFSDALGEDDLPWPMRPTDFFANPVMVHRVVNAYEASRNMSKKEKKKLKKKDKGKKKKKGKKDKKKKSKK